MTVPATHFLDVADRIGARLCRDAVWAGDRCNWLGWSTEWNGQGWAPAYRAQSASLYDGTAGIALFLSHLVRFTADPRQRIVIEGALNQVMKSMATRPPPSLGYYGGLAGIVSVFLHTFDILGDERWLKAALQSLATIAATPPDPARFDVVAGSAGTIPLLVHAAGRFGREDFLAAAQAHGDMLLGAAVVAEDASSWTAADGSNLIGYAHGAGGAACALMDLAVATGADRWREAAQSGLRFERRHFNAQWRNWPDLRALNQVATSPAASAGSYPVAWCHGATGVGFSRLLMREALKDDPEILSELEKAVETTHLALTQPIAPGNGYSLCHGAAGQADLLIEAASALARPDLHEVAAEAGRAGVKAFHDTDVPWPGGVPARGETPNLMLGIAGIGYFYLRLHAQDLVPSILVQTAKTLVGTGYDIGRPVAPVLELSQ